MASSFLVAFGINFSATKDFGPPNNEKMNAGETFLRFNFDNA